MDTTVLTQELPKLSEERAMTTGIVWNTGRPKTSDVNKTNSLQ
jgi:hypothetical protein